MKETKEIKISVEKLQAMIRNGSAKFSVTSNKTGQTFKFSMSYGNHPAYSKYDVTGWSPSGFMAPLGYVNGLGKFISGRAFNGDWGQYAQAFDWMWSNLDKGLTQATITIQDVKYNWLQPETDDFNVKWAGWKNDFAKLEAAQEAAAFAADPY